MSTWCLRHLYNFSVATRDNLDGIGIIVQINEPPPASHGAGLSFLVLQGCRCLTYRHGEGEEDLALAHLRAHRLRVSSPFASPAVLCEQGLSRTVVSRSRPLERESERASGRPYTSCSGLVSCVQATGLMLAGLTKHAAVNARRLRRRADEEG